MYDAEVKQKDTDAPNVSVFCVLRVFLAGQDWIILLAYLSGRWGTDEGYSETQPRIHLLYGLYSKTMPSTREALSFSGSDFS